VEAKLPEPLRAEMSELEAHKEPHLGVNPIPSIIPFERTSGRDVGGARPLRSCVASSGGRIVSQKSISLRILAYTELVLNGSHLFQNRCKIIIGFWQKKNLITV
jgi:hypothetical protein